MLLRKYMALLGVGSAQIDLILEKDKYRPGELVKGYFLVKGGLIEQKLNRIDCDLMMSYDERQDKKERLVDSITIYTSKIIESATTNHIPFTFQLPHSVESAREFSYRFKSRLTFKQGIESIDHDAIQILEA
ncbi:MAG: sporulation protein [Paenisporosarcina sp.]